MLALKRYQRIIGAVLAQPWAIDPDSLAWAAVCDVLALRAEGEALSDSEISARIEAARNGPRSGGSRSGTVAIIPVYGVITPRANLMSAMSGGTSAEELGSTIAAAMSDPEVDGVVFDVDSPGGNVQGIDEVASAIRSYRGQKPMVAIANHMAASAAYYIASAADEVVVTPSGAVGSIGVIAAHQDISEAQAKLGVRTTVLSAGKFKAEGSQFAPLSDEARAAFQGELDTFYGMFVRAVAKGRGVSVDAVRSGYGQGRVVLAKAALEAGMVDRIDTLEATIRRVARGGVTMRAVPAGDQAPSALLAGTRLVTVHEAVGGEPADPEDEDEPATEDAAAPASNPSPEARVLPVRLAQRRLREAALSGGHSVG